jgi:hypothetical protein
MLLVPVFGTPATASLLVGLKLTSVLSLCLARQRRAQSRCAPSTASRWRSRSQLRN